MLVELQAHLATQLTDAGLRAVTDPRNLRPPCILVHPPAFRTIQSGIVEADTTVTVITVGVGNQDAFAKLLELTDDAIEATNVIDGRPSSQDIGGTEYPAYDLTVRTTIRKD